MSAQAAQCRGILAICYAAALESDRPLRVLDFGGACGFHYLIARAAIPDLPLRWAVVETPMMAERAAALATDDLRFFSNAAAAASWLGGIDLLHSSGTLQYLPEPAATIREVCGLGASMIAWLRIFVSENTERWPQTARLVDHGPGPCPPGFVDREIIHPITELARASFFAAHDERYSLVWNFDDGDQMGDHRSAAFVFRRKELLASL
jgi:putative methyltransferase (TIGR04325 family)